MIGHSALVVEVVEVLHCLGIVTVASGDDCYDPLSFPRLDTCLEVMHLLRTCPALFLLNHGAEQLPKGPPFEGVPIECGELQMRKR